MDFRTNPFSHTNKKNGIKLHFRAKNIFRQLALS